ncbi:hypothetical protein [Methylocaldum szegediense]|jgi:hypothetical protein|nr:hypothetical protein [Methylocaldum szegediense]
MPTSLDIAAEYARQGYWDELEALIDVEPNLVNATDEFGENLLMICASF